MKKKISLILLVVLVLGIFSGCANDKFSDLPKEEQEVYKELYELYQYANKMLYSGVKLEDSEEHNKLFNKYLFKEDLLLNDEQEYLADYLVVIIDLIQNKDDIDSDFKKIMNNKLNDLKSKYNF